ncbi:hypothetical protein [Phaeobacter sp. C3_T13_0]|uniref:hypothetical protein n=1 Tax=Phaeobacter cretensis TaxID=3342641 RepID=UPI0039BD9195
MKPLALIAALALVSACSDTISYPSQLEKQANAANTVSATPVNEIRLISATTVNGGNFTSLPPIKTAVAKVTAFHPAPAVAQAQQKLRIEAANVGAYTVIGINITGVQVCPTSWGCRHATGTPVKFTN